MAYKYLTAHYLLMWIATAKAGNLALRQPSFLSSVFNGDRFAHYAVDGSPSATNGIIVAISTWQKDPYWIVDLGRTYIVDEVYVIGRDESCCWTRLIGAEIRVGDKFDNGSTSNPKCAVIPSYTGQLKKAFKCSPTALRGRYVSLNLPGENKLLELAEIIVNRNPTANIALQKPASQSSLGNDNGPASKAVDGNSDGLFGRYSCSTTHSQNNPWWRVDLGSSKPVSEVFIVNRVNVRERLTNIEIRVGDSLTDNGNINPRCGGIYTMATLYKKSFYCQPRKTGRYVNVKLVSMGSPLFLTLCEVEVYSESKAIILSDQENTTLPDGLPLSLTCPQVFGYPQPYVAWARDGVVYQNTTATAVLQSNELNENRNESEWECIVSNIHGSDFHKFFFKGNWHRMCAKHETLSSKRIVEDLIENSGEASNDSMLNEYVWFRLQHPTTLRSMQIPESCTPSMHCSTQATGWLLGSHPGIQDGVVRRTVCFSWDGNCCRYNTSILVRRCHEFYVYKLQKTSFDVKAGYCAEISSALDPDVMMKQVVQPDGPYYALVNHVINIEDDLDLYGCIAVCLSQPSCKSINHDDTRKMCELNNAKRHDVSAGDWKKRQGNAHYEMIDIVTPVIDIV